jgi:hypothetical protein
MTRCNRCGRTYDTSPPFSVHKCAVPADVKDDQNSFELANTAFKAIDQVSIKGLTDE